MMRCGGAAEASARCESAPAARGEPSMRQNMTKLGCLLLAACMSGVVPSAAAALHSAGSTARICRAITTRQAVRIG